MRSVLLVMTLGAALFFAVAYHLGLFDGSIDVAPGTGTAAVKPIEEKDLGDDLYLRLPLDPIKLPKRGNVDPIVLIGVLNPINQEEVGSPTNGKVLFIGEEVPEAAVQVAGSAAFVAEPFYNTTVHAGRQTFVKFYRRLYDGNTVTRDQMLAMIDPPKALGFVLEKIAKISAAEAEKRAAEAGESEGKIRYDTAKDLFARKVIAREELGTAQLTYIKLHNEHVAKHEAVNLARIEKDQADIELRSHEIRALLPADKYVIKTVVRQQGASVKQGDPILVVQNLERMLAEALIEEQYSSRLRKNPGRIMATIEPTIVESEIHDFAGHTRDITSVAVAKDMRIVSGSEDRTVCVWKQDTAAPLRRLRHADAVNVVACTPVKAAKNLCLAGCNDGNIYLWDLDAADKQPEVWKIAHGKDVSVTSLAFSPDGTLFASGASDGSITLWSTEDGKEKYAFIPRNGVYQRHEDSVTSLHFTPQARLISAGRDKTLRVWKLKEKGAVTEGSVISFREGNVPQLGVSPDGKWMLFDMGRSLQLQSVEEQKMYHTLSTAANATPFDTLAIFSPILYDEKGKELGSMILTAGAPQGNLQLWRTPDENTRGYEIRQFAPKNKNPATCAAFSPDAGKGGPTSFAVSGSGPNLYLWPVPTMKEIDEHRLLQVPLTLKSQTIDPTTRQTRMGFEVANPISDRYPTGRFEAGRSVTIVID